MFTLFTWNSPNDSIPTAQFSHSFVLTQPILLFAKSCPRSLHSIYSGESVSQCHLKVDRKGSLGPKKKMVSNRLCVLTEERTFQMPWMASGHWVHFWSFEFSKWFQSILWAQPFWCLCWELYPSHREARYSLWIKNCFGLNKQVSSHQSQNYQLRKGKNICFWVVCLNHFGA